MQRGDGREQSLISKVLQKKVALMIFESSGWTSPIEELADSSGQFRQAEGGKVVDDFAEEFDLLGSEFTTAERDGRRHGVVPAQNEPCQH